MAKGIKYAIGGVIILIIVGFLIFTLTIDSMVKSGIEDIGSEMTGTPVTVDNVSISAFSGRGEIAGFRVANPDGYSQDYAFEVDNFTIELDVWSLFSDVIHVKDITITGPFVYVEQKMPENNLRTILNSINESASEGTSSDTGLFIESFLMENGSADLYTEVGGERSARVEISQIELSDIGEGDDAVEQVIQQIADRLVQQALQAAARSGTEQLRDAIEGLFD